MMRVMIARLTAAKFNSKGRYYELKDEAQPKVIKAEV